MRYGFFAIIAHGDFVVAEVDPQAAQNFAILKRLSHLAAAISLWGVLGWRLFRSLALRRKSRQLGVERWMDGPLALAGVDVAEPGGHATRAGILHVAPALEYLLHL